MPSRLPVVVLDGPLGTELARRRVRTSLPAWSASALDEAPEVVADIHRDYAAAGATVHTANTFRAQPGVLGARFDRAVHRAVELARGAVPGSHRVAGSVAPVADCYRPDLSPGLASREAHRAMCAALADAGVDLLLCETFPHEVEACVAVEEAIATGLPTWLSLTTGPSDDLLSVEAVARTARVAASLGADAVLVNCVPLTAVARLLPALAAAGRPFGAYANAGVADDVTGFRSDPAFDPVAYASVVAGWIAEGATIVGGCCGTTLAQLGAVARLVRNR